MVSALIMAGLAALLTLNITRAATRTWVGQGLSPAIYPELARTDVGKLRPGTYAAGTVLGQSSTLTAVNDVQTITFGGTPTGGTMRFSFGGLETAAITWSGTAATLAARIQAALEALDNVGTGNVTVSASITVPTVTFGGDLAGQWQPLLVNTVNSLTSGTTATVAVAHTTPGNSLGGSYGAYDDTATDGTNIAKCLLQDATTVLPNGKHFLGSNVTTGRFEWCASFYIRGFFRTADLTGIDAAGVADIGKIREGDIGSLTNVATILEF